MKVANQSYAAPRAASITKLATRAAHWAFWASILRQLLAIGTTMIVSRHVTPDQFGVASMAAIFMALLVLFDTALTWATVQSADLDENKVNNLFWLGVSLGTGFWALSYLSGPALAHFFNQPALATICGTIGLAVFLNSLTTQPAALLKRQLRQKQTASIDTTALAVSSIISIALALNGQGYWAIIAQLVTMQAVRATLLLLYSGYRPGLPSRVSVHTEIRKAFGFALSNYICYFQLYLGGIIVGHAYGASALGNYQRAYSAKSLPTTYASMVVTDVMVSSLSALRKEPAKMGELYLKALRASLFVGCPAGAMLFAVAPEVVYALYGRQWATAVPLLQAFSIAALTLPISTSTIWLFLAAGKARAQLTMNLLLTAVALLVLIPLSGNPMGLLGLVIAEAALFAGPYLFANIYFSHRATGLPIAATLKVAVPIVLCSVTAAGGSWVVGEIAQVYGWQVVLAGKIAAGAVLYGLTVLCFVRPLPQYFARAA